jgi:hypothetical protein
MFPVVDIISFSVFEVMMSDFWFGMGWDLEKLRKL